MAHAHLIVGLTTFAAAFGLAGGVSTALAGPEHLGAERCGACHRAEYQDWRKSPHARALARLSEKQQRNPLCRSCHTMDPWSADPALAGVQCESCHGAGRAYAPEFVMRDEALSKLMGLQAVEEGTCKSCHRADAPRLRRFDYAALVKLVNHAEAEPTAGEAPRRTP